MAPTHTWTWNYLGESGTSLGDPEAETFPNQSDAESWLGENWRDLLARGVTEVELLDGERVEYRMPLTAD